MMYQASIQTECSSCVMKWTRQRASALGSPCQRASGRGRHPTPPTHAASVSARKALLGNPRPWRPICAPTPQCPIHPAAQACSPGLPGLHASAATTQRNKLLTHTGHPRRSFNSRFFAAGAVAGPPGKIQRLSFRKSLVSHPCLEHPGGAQGMAAYAVHILFLAWPLLWLDEQFLLLPLLHNSSAFSSCRLTVQRAPLHPDRYPPSPKSSSPSCSKPSLFFSFPSTTLLCRTPSSLWHPWCVTNPALPCLALPCYPILWLPWVVLHMPVLQWPT